MAEPEKDVGMKADQKPVEAVSSSIAPSQPPPSTAVDEAVADDSDPDFDDLDDVLDQFSAAQNAPAQSKPTPSSSGPGRPEDPPTDDIPVPQGPAKDESEEDFMARLTVEMQSVMSKMSAEATNNSASPEDMAKMGKELEEFTRKMEEQGVQPEDLLKAILGEDLGGKVGESANEERDRRESESKSKERDVGKKPVKFEDTIRKTMERMEDSSTKATNAVQSSSEDDILAEMLRALESEGGEGDGDLSKMFMGMMEQLTNKDMLYEPMAELNSKYPEWLSSNKSKLKTEDFARYSRQKVIVKDIVGKFDEKGYSDDDPKCREFIWEKMQKMQEEGAPPEDLITNPFPGMPGMSGLPGLGGEGPEEGCPTQ